MPSVLPGEWNNYRDVLKENQLIYDPIYLESITTKIFNEISTIIKNTPLDLLKSLNLTNEDALSGRVFKFSGNWIDENYNFAFTLHVSENLKYQHLNTHEIKFVTGNLSWTLLVIVKFFKTY